VTIFVTFGQLGTSFPHDAKPAMHKEYFYALLEKHNPLGDKNLLK
jgi:hypothetical protein